MVIPGEIVLKSITTPLSIIDPSVPRKLLSDIIIWSKYARYIPELKRRETWDEIVDRNKKMHVEKFPQLQDEINNAYSLVYEKKILPSMRSLQFAGKPIKINASRLFNCSYLAMETIDAFSEVMFLLLSGCGVGYSVQQHHVKRLPVILKYTRSRKYLIGDSIEGWADSIKVLMTAFFESKPLPIFDFSDIRVKGASLITSGGKAPGPEPLRECLRNIQEILERKQNGDKLTSLEIHDICCYIADAVLAGGIRRSATISLFSLTDEEMIGCKGYYKLSPAGEAEQNGTTTRFYVEYQGRRKLVVLPIEEYDKYLSDHLVAWYHVAPQRSRANNSVVMLRHKITKNTFDEFWEKIKNSGSGEPGFMFSNNKDMGLNPCAEISLKNRGFCNLVEVNVGDITEKDQGELEQRCKFAAFIATLQASYTDFHYLHEEWKETADKEALIGVSMTGIASGGVLSLNLESAADVVKKENVRVAKLIGINKAARCTTVKPSGTTSLVVGSSSGIHAWHNDYYIRRIRVGKDEPIYHYMMNTHPQLIEDEHFRPTTQAVISIPQAAPEKAIIRSKETAIDLLTRVSKVWSEWVKVGHRKGDNMNNVSTTVTVKPNEWDEVRDWLWDNKNSYSAISILPYADHEYIQSPLEDISEQEYLQLVNKLKLTTFDSANIIESSDGTTLSGEVACAGGACLI